MANAILLVKLARKVYIRNASRYGPDTKKIQAFLSLVLFVEHNFKIQWSSSLKILRNGRRDTKHIRELFVKDVG